MTYFFDKYEDGESELLKVEVKTSRELTEDQVEILREAIQSMSDGLCMFVRVIE